MCVFPQFALSTIYLWYVVAGGFATYCLCRPDFLQRNCISAFLSMVVFLPGIPSEQALCSVGFRFRRDLALRASILIFWAACQAVCWPHCDSRAVETPFHKCRPASRRQAPDCLLPSPSPHFRLPSFSQPRIPTPPPTCSLAAYSARSNLKQPKRLQAAPPRGPAGPARAAHWPSRFLSTACGGWTLATRGLGRNPTPSAIPSSLGAPAALPAASEALRARWEASGLKRRCETSRGWCPRPLGPTAAPPAQVSHGNTGGGGGIGATVAEVYTAAY
jgi:hypothetical protein